MSLPARADFMAPEPFSLMANSPRRDPGLFRIPAFEPGSSDGLARLDGTRGMRKVGLISGIRRRHPEPAEMVPIRFGSPPIFAVGRSQKRLDTPRKV